MIKTILVDDHKLFCEGLERLLNESQHFTVIKTFHTGLSVLENIKRLSPDMLLIDVEMPGISGLDVVRSIRKENASIKIIILSMHEEGMYAREARNFGANGYMIKSIESTTLIQSLLKIFNGENIFSKANAASPIEAKILSKQELKILKLVAIGRSSKQIADDLIISEQTVKTHRKNIIRKLNVSNTAELIKVGYDRGFL